MKIILIGSPGAGKGTQAKILSNKFDIAHISTGDMLREEINIKSELGLKISNIIESGELVPDEIVSELLKNRIKKDDCKKGFILDGYPRNVAQAESLPSIIGEINKVILIQTDDEIIIERMSGRRICKECGHMFHIKNNPPKKEKVCDVCGGELIQRKDDNLETVKNRLNVYNKSTTPLINYYKEKNNVIEVNGAENIEKVSQKLINCLQNI